MAIIRFKDALKLNKKDLASKMLELKRELMRYQSQVASGTAPENPGKIREIRRTLAKLVSIARKEVVKQRDE